MVLSVRWFKIVVVESTVDPLYDLVFAQIIDVCYCEGYITHTHFLQCLYLCKKDLIENITHRWQMEAWSLPNCQLA